MAKLHREVRIETTHYGERPISIVDSSAWVMVKRADIGAAAPFVISRKEWDRLPIQPDGGQ